MKQKIILALDLTNAEEALRLADELRGGLSHIKIGHQLYAQGGMAFVKKIMGMGYNVFLDLKLHDIPNTVRMAVEELVSHGLWAVSIHAAGGRKMLEEARAATERAGVKTNLLAISVLTSFSQEIWSEVNPNGTINEALSARAAVVRDVGIQGMVCSPLDLPIVKPILGDKVMTVVPGVRLVKGGDDQERAASPAKALENGADYIVVGRPILEANDRFAAINEIAADMGGGK